MNNEPSKNNEAFKKRYFSQMIAKIMSEEAKRLSISPLEKDVWQELREKVRSIVREYYRTKTFEELLEDMKRYNIKQPFKLSSSTPDEHNFSENHDICYRLQGDLSLDRVKWVEHNRRELLKMITKQLCRIGSTLTTMGIKAYHRYPFVIGGRVYFAVLYIPASRTIIEVVKRAKKSSEYVDQEDRFDALRLVCDQLIVLDDDIYTEKRIMKELAPQCLKNVVLGPLGQPMNKIV